MSTSLTWTRYNTLFEREGVYLFYNSLSNGFVSLSPEIYSLLSKIRPGEDVELEDKELMEALRKMKAVCDEELELRKVKFRNHTHRFQNDTLILTINPTFACNFACPYCFEADHPNSRMSDETAEELIDFITRHSPKRISVTWFGGEPLLEFPRIKSLTEDILALNVPYYATMITNGYLLTEDVIRQLESLKIGRLQITLDGLAETHDQRRCLKNGTPTFQRIYDNLVKAAVLSPNTEIGVRVNIDKDNAEAFIKLHRLLSNKYKNIKVYPAFVSDIQNEGNLPCTMNREEQFGFMKSLFRDYGISFNTFYPSNRRQECAVRCPKSITIGPNGELYKCWNDVAIPEKVYGYINGEITNESLLYDYLMGADPFESKKCRECILLPVCSGGCPHTRLLDLKNGTNNACPLETSLLEDYLWEHYQVRKQKSDHNK